MAGVSVWTNTDATNSAHLSIRHQVFVAEQRLMVLTDVDEWDRDPETKNILAARGTEIAGTVRVYAVSDRIWKGDRLAVLKGHRLSTVGADLVRYAVATAAEAGGSIMEATVQARNTRFFERLGWSRDGDVRPYYGEPHQPMVISLSNVAPIASQPTAQALLRLPSVDMSDSSLLICA